MTVFKLLQTLNMVGAMIIKTIDEHASDTILQQLENRRYLHFTTVQTVTTDQKTAT